MDSVIIEQRIVVKFNFKLGKTAPKTYNLLKEVYGSECLSHARVFEWFRRFKDGRQDVEDDSRPGHPLTLGTDDNVEKVASLIRSDRRLSIRAIAETVRRKNKKKTTRNVEGKIMNVPPRQCTNSFRVICQEISGQTWHFSVRASILLARTGTK